ncbi:unnamed protein product [Rotaria magnacalcarata]|uniref:TIR domain-containing protein n=1 Tax=Rotaria magnacalcarata TaxID=392030 RepID=A0A815P7X5_9BILA|nr:unnamed protein product [Rotaria magnacalcarata]CAF1445357.1 unnamed protein product [Rotaria magnacalcarata]
MIGLLDSIPVQQRPTYSHQTIFHHQRGPGLSNSVSMLCDRIIGKENISTLELTKLLEKILRKLKRVQDSEQLLNLNAIVIALKHISSSILVSIAPHKFFIQLEEPLRNVIEKWLTNSNLNDDEAFAFRNIIKLLRTLYKNAEHNDFHPSWLFDSPFLNIIATCLTNLSKPENRFFENTPFESKCLTRLLRIYDRYQERLHTQNSSNRDALIQLIDPIVQCITSENYLDSFRKLQSNSLDSKQKFFLLRCPSLFITYNGSRLKSIVNNVLSEMLPKYIAVLNEVVPSMKRWKKSIFPAVDNLLKIASHGSSSKKVIEAYRNFIDSMITIASSPILSNDLSYESSSSETNLIDTANNLFANRISKPTILAKAPGKQLQSNIQITSEEDIKTMPNSGISLSTILTSLKDSTHGNPNELDYHEIEQLLKTIRDLFQNDDMKKELLKQNQLPFLLELTDKIHGELLALLLEIIWSLSFIPEAALEIRSNPKFVRDIENISKNNENDEEISKASEGILWKIIQEPAVLEEKAKQHPKEKNADEIVEVSDVVNRTDGKEEVVMKNHQRASIEQAERVFKYDIMISYCHADKDLVKQIHKFLSGQGFKIWIDLDNMFGPAMSAMAEAVEESEFVFMCIKPSIEDVYKKSIHLLTTPSSSRMFPAC